MWLHGLYAGVFAGAAVSYRYAGVASNAHCQ